MRTTIFTNGGTGKNCADGDNKAPENKGIDLVYTWYSNSECLGVILQLHVEAQ